MKNNLLELKRQLLNEVRWITSSLNIPIDSLSIFPQKKEKNKLLEKLREFQRAALESQQVTDEYRICGSGFKMKC